MKKKCSSISFVAIGVLNPVVLLNALRCPSLKFYVKGFLFAKYALIVIFLGFFLCFLTLYELDDLQNNKKKHF